MIKDILKYIIKHKKIYFAVTFVLILDYYFVTLPTKLLGMMSDKINLGTIVFNDVFNIALTLFSLAIFIYILEIFWMYFLFKQGEIQKKENLLKSFQTIIYNRSLFFEKYSIADIIMHLNGDKENYGDMFGYGAMSFLISISIIIFVIPSMFMISIKLSLIVIVAIVLLGIIVYYLGDLIENKAEELRLDVEALNNDILESVEGIRVIKIFNSFQTEFTNFQDKNLKLSKKILQINAIDSIFQKVAQLLTSLSIVFVLYFGTYSIAYNYLSIGQLISLQILASLLIEPMWILSSFVYVYLNAKISHRKLTTFINFDDGLNNLGDTELVKLKSIEFKNYYFKYPKSNFKNLKNINLTINKGETLAIVGKTGSGKTTLIKQLLRQYPKGEGFFLINNIDVDNYNLKSLNSKISYVPQDHILFSKTILENINFTVENYDPIHIDEVIKLSALKDDLLNLSNGINTLVGEKGVAISGGQKQRIAIARAFLKNTEILILDDALSAVDVKTEHQIIENIKKIRKGLTNIIISHRFSSIMFADKVIVMEDGEIIEQGSISDLLANKKWFYNQFINQKMEINNEISD